MGMDGVGEAMNGSVKNDLGARFLAGVVGRSDRMIHAVIMVDIVASKTIIWIYQVIEPCSTDMEKRTSIP
jgi:hypothetical protein